MTYRLDVEMDPFNAEEFWRVRQLLPSGLIYSRAEAQATLEAVAQAMIDALPDDGTTMQHVPGEIRYRDITVRLVEVPHD